MSKKKFLFSILLHVLHGFVLEKSKLYYPYTFDRNILLIKTDLYKYYLAISFIFLSLPYLLSKISPNRYFSARTSVENRYQSRNVVDIQLGGYLMGISMILTGFCPSFLPMYLAISPILFCYCIAASYIAFIFYHVFGRLIIHRLNVSRINNNTHNSSTPSNEKETLNNIGRFIIIAICILVLLVLETCEQSLLAGHSSDELFDLIYYGDYLPPGLSGVLCGIVKFCLIFYCNENQTLTSEWLINIFYHTSDTTSNKSNIPDYLCIEQVLKMLSIALGVRLSLFMSKRQETPHIDWLFYILAGFGSFLGALSMCFTTATFTDHVQLISGFTGSVPVEIISLTLGVAWVLLYLCKLVGLSSVK